MRFGVAPRTDIKKIALHAWKIITMLCSTVNTKWCKISLKSWTSPRYFSNSTSSSITRGQFCPFIGWVLLQKKSLRQLFHSYVPCMATSHRPTYIWADVKHPLTNFRGCHVRDGATLQRNFRTWPKIVALAFLKGRLTTNPILSALHLQDLKSNIYMCTFN